MRADLAPGLRHSNSVAVDPRMTAETLSHIFSEERYLPVFGTPAMITFMELTCADAVKPYLEAGEATVGTRVEMSHIAATPLGMKVTAEVELIEVKGRMLRFKVVCRDERDVIGEGFHERGVINTAKFMDKLAAKTA